MEPCALSYEGFALLSRGPGSISRTAHAAANPKQDRTSHGGFGKDGLVHGNYNAYLTR